MSEPTSTEPPRSARVGDETRDPGLLFGVAMLPETGLQRDLVRFRQKQGRLLDGPVLGMDANLPHVTILQCPYRPDELTPEALASISDQIAAPIVGTFAALEYQAVGWAFAMLEPNAALVDVQDRALERTRAAIDTALIDTDVTGCDLGMAASQMEFGYRYVGENFRPHVTLGRVGLEVPQRCVADFAQEFTGRSVRFDRLVFYRAGPSGVLASVLSSVRIAVE